MYQQALNGYEKLWRPDHMSALEKRATTWVESNAKEGKLEEAEAMFRQGGGEDLKRIPARQSDIPISHREICSPFLKYLSKPDNVQLQSRKSRHQPF